MAISPSVVNIRYTLSCTRPADDFYISQSCDDEEKEGKNIPSKHLRRGCIVGNRAKQRAGYCQVVTQLEFGLALEACSEPVANST